MNKKTAKTSFSEKTDTLLKLSTQMILMIVAGFIMSAASFARQDAPTDATVAATSGPPVAAPYLIGPNDVVSVSVFRQPELAAQVRVATDNSVLLPVVGKISIGGYSEQEASLVIETALRDGGIVRNPSVFVQVTRYASQRVSVLGFVISPGSYVLDRTTRLSGILGLAGGAAAEGSDELLFTDYDPKTGATERHRIKIDSLLSGENPENDFILGNGDIVYVPREQYFYIYGEVRAPGRYRVTDDLTLEQGLALAGGTTELGSRNGVKIRVSENGKDKLKSTELTDIVKVGDVFYVPQRLF
jgi:polysaccharide export outer membrane protein